MSLKGVAQETLAILEAGHFIGPSGVRVELGDEQRAAEAATKLITPERGQELLAQGAPGGPAPTIEVTDETTQVAAHRLVVDEEVSDLVLLNYASARNPGGGFITGAKAQEEDLTRCSGLYPCLLTQPDYYEVNRRQSSMLYTHHLIYSPHVPWFRTRSRNLLDTMFLASVITAPAPNAGQALRRDPAAGPDIEASLRHRAGTILAVAHTFSHRNLLLGAWGCGVFRNDPNLVADAFGSWLESPRFRGCFDRVVFAVYDRGKERTTLRAFEARFTEAAASA